LRAFNSLRRAFRAAWRIRAKTQREREDEAARRANKVLIGDTNAIATSVWRRRYMGERSPEVEAIPLPLRRVARPLQQRCRMH